MSGAAPYGFQLEPTTIEGIRTKMMKPDPETADIAKLMFEMYSQPGISFGDIARYFADEGILIYGKEMKRGFISQLLRNPIYAQADLDMYRVLQKAGCGGGAKKHKMLPGQTVAISIRAGTCRKEKTST